MGLKSGSDQDGAREAKGEQPRDVRVCYDDRERGERCWGGVLNPPCSRQARRV